MRQGSGDHYQGHRQERGPEFRRQGEGMGQKDPRIQREITHVKNVLFTLFTSQDSSVSTKLKSRAGAVAHKVFIWAFFRWFLRGLGQFIYRHRVITLGPLGRNASEDLMEMVEERKEAVPDT